jgi:hypothetical protein
VFEHVIYDGRSSFGSSVNVPICFHTNGKANEKLRFDGTGRFAIGHNLNGAADYNRLVIHNPHSGSSWMQLTSTASGNGINTDGLAIGLNSTNTGHIWLRENADLVFATNGTKRMSILAGGGLAFNNDTAAANALDDYEEGTWTPSYRYGANVTTTGNSNGEYVRIGNLVYIRGYLQNSYVAGGQSWNADIAGLPFTPNSGGYGIYAISAFGTNWSYGSGMYGIIANVSESHASVFLRANNSQGHNSTPTAYNMTNTTATYIAGCYHTLGY